MADRTSRNARIELAATVRVAKFKSEDGSEKSLVDLTVEDAWARDDCSANGGGRRDAAVERARSRHSRAMEDLAETDVVEPFA